MKNKLRYLRIIFLIIAIVAAVFANGGFSFTVNKTALAVGDLSVDWGVPSGDPIFVVDNIAPGNLEERDVSVTNNGAVARTVGVRSEIVSDTGSLADALLVEISESGTDLYGGTSGAKTLSEFFNDSANPVGIPLSDLAPGADTSYKFKVIFDENSGNQYQNQTVVFDLIIGITVDIPDECEELEIQNVIFGTSENNKIKGTGQNELIFGLDGADNIDGGGGDDCIVGGEGNDKMDGGSGKDVLVDLFGNNHFEGGSGADKLFAGNGNDKMEGGSGNDIIFAGEGNDNLEGGTDHDHIFGGDGNDKLDGGSGNDLLFGEDGNDTIKGGSGNDALDGGSGNNNLNGESGTDTCSNGLAQKCEP